MLFLTGCSFLDRKKEYVEKLVPEYPPDTLLNDCRKSRLDIAGQKTNEKVVEYIERLKEDIDLCTTDKKALREWKRNDLDKKDTNK